GGGLRGRVALGVSGRRRAQQDYEQCGSGAREQRSQPRAVELTYGDGSDLSHATSLLATARNARCHVRPRSREREAWYPASPESAVQQSATQGARTVRATSCPASGA